MSLLTNLTAAMQRIAAEFSTIRSDVLQYMPQMFVLAANVATTSNVRANVAAWPIAVVAGNKYIVKVLAKHTSAVGTTGGSLGLAVSGGATGNVSGYADGTLTNAQAATNLRIPITATNGFITTTGTTGTSQITMDFTFQCTASGNLHIQWGSEVNGSTATLLAGSSMTFQQTL